MALVRKNLTAAGIVPIYSIVPSTPQALWKWSGVARASSSAHGNAAPLNWFTMTTPIDPKSLSFPARAGKGVFIGLGIIILVFFVLDLAGIALRH
jgi:hypothetical protein